MKPIANLDMRFCLPIIRKAYNGQQLQMFKDYSTSEFKPCLYAGPCAIGVCLTPIAQEALDVRLDNTSISVYLRKGIVTAPKEQHEDFFRLQETHDQVLNGDLEVVDFGHVLSQLEQKYLSRTGI